MPCWSLQYGIAVAAGGGRAQQRVQCLNLQCVRPWPVQPFRDQANNSHCAPSTMPAKGKPKQKALQPKAKAKGKAKAKAKVKAKAKAKAKVKAKAKAKANTAATAVRKRPAQNTDQTTAATEEHTEEHIEEVTGETLVVADSTEEDGPLDPQLGRKFRNALVKAPPEVLATVRRVESLPVRSGKTTLWRQMVMAWATEGWTSALFQSTEAMTNSTSAEITIDAMTLTMMLGSLHNDRALLKEGLERGDIVTVEHPQQPGVLLYKHTLYRETAKQQAKTTLSLSKSGDTTAGATDEVVDNTVSWQFSKASASGASASLGCFHWRMPARPKSFH